MARRRPSIVTRVIEDTEVELGQREAEVLDYLSKEAKKGHRPGAEDIEAAVWGAVESVPPGHIARVTLQRARDKLQRAGLSRALVENVYGEGYTIISYGAAKSKK